MRLLSIAIVRFIDDEPQPGVVECELVDADGKVHRFVEKTAVVSSDHLFRNTAYPRPGVIACEVESSWVDENGQALARVNTNPWSVESIDGVATFVVRTSLIREEA
ncbi:MAG: hypothetical protein SGI91_12190 [Alphaproteobacteria bacterium]|nr:hypothetical protein [Alphaproteobacteria bacterium]